MIDYLVTYQNTYVFAHLFQSNIVPLIEKGVTMTNLFKSQIFNYTFDFDDWPATSSDTKKMLAPYNRSVFKLRHFYNEVFP